MRRRFREMLAARRRARNRVRLTWQTWQTCRRCGSQSFLPTRGERLCGGCLSLR